VVGVLAPAFLGNHLVAMKTFDFMPYLRKAAEVRSTILRLVPATAIRLIKDPEAKSLDLSAVQTVYCAGASLETTVAQALQRMLNGTVILNGYGMSEGTISMLRENWSERKAGSIGKPAAGNSIRVVDDNYNDVPVGTDGECLWKGPTLFIGYKNNAEETRASFHDGWLCTGDVVRVDEDGYFFITGRKKELIKFKGNQVPPAEIEAVLLSHPLVTDAGVCGVYDQDLEGEVPVGYVSLDTVHSKDREKTLEDVKAFVHERVARYKQLRGGLFHLPEMPKNSNGKLMRRELPAKKEELRRSKL
jgi:acyl-coenzyme A synthetase/AMP-(fatty) acid ligase